MHSTDLHILFFWCTLSTLLSPIDMYSSHTIWKSYTHLSIPCSRLLSHITLPASVVVNEVVGVVVKVDMMGLMSDGVPGRTGTPDVRVDIDIMMI